MLLSYAVHLLGDRTLVDRLTMLRRAGFDGVDIPAAMLTDLSARAPLTDSGLPVAAIYSQVRDPGLLSARAAERATALDQLVARATAGAELGASAMVLVPCFGPARIRSFGPTLDLDAVETGVLLAGLDELAERLVDVPITVALEPLNPQETHYLLDPERGLAIADAVGSPRIGPMLDIYHCDLNGQDIPAKVAALGDRLALVHLSDSDRGLPGSGSIDFGAVLKALRGQGYGGWMGLECRNPEDDEAIASSVRHLRALWEKAAPAEQADDPEGSST